MDECSIESCRVDLELLKTLTELVVIKEEGNYKELDVKSGFCSLNGLFKAKNVAISRAHAKAGTEVDWHAHNATEIIGVYQGQMEINMDGHKFNIPELEIIIIDAGVPHTVYFPVETRLWAVTMPASNSFPEGLEDDKINN